MLRIELFVRLHLLWSPLDKHSENTEPYRLSYTICHRRPAYAYFSWLNQHEIQNLLTWWMLARSSGSNCRVWQTEPGTPRGEIPPTHCCYSFFLKAHDEVLGDFEHHGKLLASCRKVSGYSVSYLGFQAVPLGSWFRSNHVLTLL